MAFFESQLPESLPPESLVVSAERTPRSPAWLAAQVENVLEGPQSDRYRATVEVADVLRNCDRDGRVLVSDGRNVARFLLPTRLRGKRCALGKIRVVYDGSFFFTARQARILEDLPDEEEELPDVNADVALPTAHDVAGLVAEHQGGPETAESVLAARNNLPASPPVLAPGSPLSPRGKSPHRDANELALPEETAVSPGANELALPEETAASSRDDDCSAAAKKKSPGTKEKTKSPGNKGQTAPSPGLDREDMPQLAERLADFEQDVSPFPIFDEDSDDDDDEDEDYVPTTKSRTTPPKKQRPQRRVSSQKPPTGRRVPPERDDDDDGEDRRQVENDDDDDDERPPTRRVPHRRERPLFQLEDDERPPPEERRFSPRAQVRRRIARRNLLGDSDDDVPAAKRPRVVRSHRRDDSDDEDELPAAKRPRVVRSHRRDDSDEDEIPAMRSRKTPKFTPYLPLGERPENPLRVYYRERARRMVPDLPPKPRLARGASAFRVFRGDPDALTAWLAHQPASEIAGWVTERLGKTPALDLNIDIRRLVLHTCYP